MTQNSSPIQQSQKARPHLPFLDGIRGLAALYVLMGHVAHWIVWWAAEHNQASPFLKLFRPFCFPTYAVDMFIVLSGFCLMLPLVTKGTIAQKFDFWPYLQRRAKRIYPPYLFAFSLTLVLIAIARTLFPEGEHIPATPTWANIVAHYLLVHNLNSEWAQTLNAPLWSVATEWQIYFLFPLVLLPVRRYAGRVLPIIVALGLGWGLLYVVGSRIFLASPWLIGLFAMGMVGAELAVSQEEKVRDLRQRIPWLTISIVGAILFVITGVLYSHGFSKYQYLADPVFGLLAMALLIALSNATTEKSGALIQNLKKLFESKIAIKLGHYSYSIYLMHLPPLYLFVDPLCQRLNLSLHAHMLVGILFVPFALLLTYVFHLCCERPFLNASKAKSPQQSVSNKEEISDNSVGTVGVQ